MLYDDGIGSPDWLRAAVGTWILVSGRRRDARQRRLSLSDIDDPGEPGCKVRREILREVRDLEHQRQRETRRRYQ